MYYSSKCQLCILEVKKLLEHRDKIENVYIIFASSESYNALERFNKDFVRKYTRTEIISVSRDNFYNSFGTSKTPSFLFYNKWGALKAHANRVNDILPAILKYAKEIEVKQN